MEKEKGRVHSIESFGTVDGPGIRLVVFFQGCPMRCKYCHNPDTWAAGKGTVMAVDEILALYEKNRSFYRGGGITATGGEPLMQMEFLTGLFARAKAEGIHTCLDTSGVLYRRARQSQFEELFANLDLVLLDIKHSDPQGHRALTGQELEPVLSFAGALEEKGIPMIIRHVALPGITDSQEELLGLGRLIGNFRNLTGLEVLPYHTMGVEKYRQMGIPYPLEGISAMEEEAALDARKWILEGVSKVRREKASASILNSLNN
ncbi:MAG: pyruvate formate-lyase-activating protein [Blautia sp.]|jgi:pyruvate formate lyase activating enzyme